MAVRKIKNRWYVDFRVEYLRYRKPSPENSKVGAEAYEAILRQKLARGESIDRSRDVEHRTFEQFVWEWFDTYVVPNNKHSEQRTKKDILKGSLVPFFGNMVVSEITSYQIEQYKAQLSKMGVSNKTIKNRLSVLHKCLTMAYEWLELEGQPPRITWPRCTPPQMDFLSFSECELLLTNTGGIGYELILTATRTGMRQGELKGLQWSAINWQNRSLTVQYSRDDRAKVLTSPKNNRIRHIPLDTDVYEALFRRKKDTGYVFTDGNQPFNHRRITKLLDKACKGAGLRKLRWHTLRHTFASHLAMNGVPMTAIKELMGHSSITTTMRYSHLAPSMLRNAIDVLNPKTGLDTKFGQPVGNRWQASLK